MPELNKANRQVCDVDIRILQTGEPYLFFDTANTTTAGLSGDAVYAMAKGSRRIAFQNPIEGTMTIEAQVYPFKFFGLLSNGVIETNGAYSVKQNITCTTAGELDIKLSNGSVVPGTVFVFPKGKFGDHASNIAGTFENDKFTATESAQIEAEAEYEVGFMVNRDSGVQRISFNNRNLPQDYKITMSTLDKDEQGALTPFLITAYKASIQRTFELSFSSEGDPASVNLTFDLLEDKDGNVMDMVEVLEDIKSDEPSSGGQTDTTGKVSTYTQDSTIEDLGDKKVSDIISADTAIEADGSVTGTLNYITGWSEFSSNPEEQNGNFFPIKLDDAYQGQTIKVTKRAPNVTISSRLIEGYTETVKEAQDLEWVIRVPNKDTTFKFEANDVELFTLNFKKASLASTNALEYVQVIEQSHDFGSLKKKASDIMSEDVAIGFDGAVTGTLKYVPLWKEFSSNEAQQKGHYIAVRLKAPYNAKPVTVTGKNSKTETDEDWVLIVENNDSTFKFESEGKELFTLTFKDAVFEGRKTGANAVSAPHGEENLGIVERASDIVEDNYTIEWEGNAGTLNGHVKWHEFADEHFASKKTGRYVPLTVSGYYGCELSITNLDATEYEINGSNIVIRIDEVGARYVGISCGKDEIASITFGGLTMEKPLGSQVLTIADQGDTIDSKLVSDYCDADVAIAWESGNIGNVTGTFKKKDDASQKWLLPVKLNAFFKTGEVSIYGVSSFTEDMKAFIPITNNKSTIMIKSGTQVVATLKFTSATLQE